MATAALPDPLVDDPAALRNFDALLQAINALGQFISSGTGAPSGTPSSSALYFRQDPSPGAAVYLFDGTNWTAVV